MAKKKSKKVVRRVKVKARSTKAIVVSLNPKSRRRNSIRRFSYGRNPLAIVQKIGLPPVKEIALLGVGAVAAEAGIARALTMLPPIFSTHPIARAVSRLALVAAAGFAAQKILSRENAKAVLYGALANQAPKIVNDVLSLTGVKLSDGEDDLALYTLSAGEPQIGQGENQPTVGMYTMSEGDSEPVLG